jgi:hypothetical protein
VYFDRPGQRFLSCGAGQDSYFYYVINLVARSL